MRVNSRRGLPARFRDFNPGTLLDRNELKRTDLFTQYALVAADQAIKDSGF